MTGLGFTGAATAGVAAVFSAGAASLESELSAASALFMTGALAGSGLLSASGAALMGGGAAVAGAAGVAAPFPKWRNPACSAAELWYSACGGAVATCGAAA